MAVLVETTGSREEVQTGWWRIVRATFTAGVANGDTWDPGLTQVHHVDFKPATAAATTQWAATITNGAQARIAFVVESGTIGAAGTNTAIAIGW